MHSIISDFSMHLRRHGLRLTEERRRLLDLILSLKGHFNTEEVLKEVHRKKARVSRATVYRMLPLLVQADLIQQSLLSSEGQTQFEVTWNRSHHDHLICAQCGKVIEFQHRTIEILQREIANKYGFILDHHVMELVGRCRHCRDELSTMSIKREMPRG